jgi:hypothetical protein
MYNDYTHFDNDFDAMTNDNSSSSEDESLFFSKDKNYDVYSVPCVPFKTKDNKWVKKVNIHSYGSAGLGSNIRNAVTGAYYNYTVGSANEDFLFKVIDSTGRNNRRDPLMLYYDNPEQYEKHKHTQVSQKSKERWHKKYLRALERL